MEATPSHAATEVTQGAAGLAGNLGQRSQDARLRMGVVVFGCATLAAAVGLEQHLSGALLSLLFLPFLVGSNGIWTGLYNICPSMAYRNRRNVGCGVEAVNVPADRRAARRLARRAVAQSFAMAIAATGAVVLASVSRW